jgi:hypothetical protein
MIESIAFGPAIGKDTIFSSKEALIAARPRRQPDRNLTELVVWFEIPRIRSDDGHFDAKHWDLLEHWLLR